MIANFGGKLSTGFDCDPDEARKGNGGDGVGAVFHDGEFGISPSGEKVDEEEKSRGEKVFWASEDEAEVGKDSSAEESATIEAGELSDSEEEGSESGKNEDSCEEIRPGEIAEKKDKGEGCNGDDEVVDACTEDAFGHSYGEGDGNGKEDIGEEV